MEAEPCFLRKEPEVSLRAQMQPREPELFEVGWVTPSHPSSPLKIIASLMNATCPRRLGGHGELLQAVVAQALAEAWQQRAVSSGRQPQH